MNRSCRHAWQWAPGGATIRCTSTVRALRGSAARRWTYAPYMAGSSRAPTVCVCGMRTSVRVCTPNIPRRGLGTSTQNSYGEKRNNNGSNSAAPRRASHATLSIFRAEGCAIDGTHGRQVLYRKKQKDVTARRWISARRSCGRRSIQRARGEASISSAKGPRRATARLCIARPCPSGGVGCAMQLR